MIDNGLRAEHRRDGFTIVELIVIIIVIGILVALTVMSYNLVLRTVNEQGIASDLQKFTTAANKFKSENGAFPSVMDQLDFKSSEGVALQYSYTSSNDSYCVTGSLKGVDVYIKSGSRETKGGGCPGHGIAGKPAITNVAVNPSAETDTSGVSGYFSSPIARPSGNAASGNYSFSTTTNSASNKQGIIHTITNDGKPNQAYSCSMSVKGTSGASVSVSGRPSTASGGYIGENYGGKVVTLTSSWQVVDFQFTSPASMGVLRVQVVNNAVGAGTVIQADAFICTEGSTVYKFADGSTPNWVWNGTPNASTSSGPAL